MSAKKSPVVVRVEKQLEGTYVAQYKTDDSGMPPWYNLTSVTGNQVIAQSDDFQALRRWALRHGAKRVEVIK